MKIDQSKNRAYYRNDISIPCNCEICQMFYNNINSKYPEVVEYLKSINVDPLRPFELIWTENEENNEIEFDSCQYIVFGECDEDFKHQINDVIFEKNQSFHPSTNHISDNHFIIDFGKISLPNKL